MFFLQYFSFLLQHPFKKTEQVLTYLIRKLTDGYIKAKKFNWHDQRYSVHVKYKIRTQLNMFPNVVLILKAFSLRSILRSSG